MLNDPSRKPVHFIGNAKEDLKQWPEKQRKAAGYEIDKIQQGFPPTDTKIVRTIGKGAYELRIKVDGAWRVFYVAKFDEAIYVLHAFQKKTEKTAKKDIDLGKQRYNQMIQHRNSIRDGP